MDKLLKAISEILTDRGITNSDYRIKLLNKEIISNSDWAFIEIEIYRPRKKKPCQYRKLAINFVRNIIDFDKSSFVNY